MYQRYSFRQQQQQQHQQHLCQQNQCCRAALEDNLINYGIYLSVQEANRSKEVDRTDRVKEVSPSSPHQHFHHQTTQQQLLQYQQHDSRSNSICRSCCSKTSSDGECSKIVTFADESTASPTPSPASANPPNNNNNDDFNKSDADVSDGNKPSERSECLKNGDVVFSRLEEVGTNSTQSSVTEDKFMPFSSSATANSSFSNVTTSITIIHSTNSSTRTLLSTFTTRNSFASTQETSLATQEHQTSQQLGNISRENVGMMAKLTSHQMAFAPHPLINWPPPPPPPRQTLPLKKHSGELRNGPLPTQSTSSNQVKLLSEDRNSMYESKLEFSGNQTVCGVSNPITYSSPSFSNPLIQGRTNTTVLSTLTTSTTEDSQEATSCSAKPSSQCPCLRSTITSSNSSHEIVSSNHLTTSASTFTKKISNASNISDVKSATSTPKCDQSQKPAIKAKPQLPHVDRQPKENVDKIRSSEIDVFQHSTEKDHLTDCCEKEAKFSDADQSRIFNQVLLF